MRRTTEALWHHAACTWVLMGCHACPASSGPGSDPLYGGMTSRGHRDWRGKSLTSDPELKLSQGVGRQGCGGHEGQMSRSLSPRQAPGTSSVTAHCPSGQGKLGLLGGASESPPQGHRDTFGVVTGASEGKGIRSWKASLPQFPHVSDQSVERLGALGSVGGGGSGGLRSPPSWAVCAGPSQGGGRRGRQLPPGPQGARDPKCGVHVGGLEASPASPVHDLSSKVASWSFERSPPEPSRPVPAVPSVSRRVRSGVSHEWDPMPCGPCVGLLSTCQARGFRGACPCRPGWSASSCLFLNRRTSGRFYPLAVVNPANARPDFSADADAHFSQPQEGRRSH
ncbi:otolin-1-like isoform X2 [Acinonyx jubatus]|uniref:Otolin-1-like isoform X2 n=1 Tax=Acinonyx jubatus TaxID=32536 RepID=A0ABM3NLP5_ACIJB|nr:otolin-1-like isoform X2 [Acinonyx jubatus]